MPKTTTRTTPTTPPTPVTLEGVQWRQATIERDALATRAEGDERIPVCISSELPVARWFGREVLDHSPEAVDLSYAERGIPFLDSHDQTRIIGLIEEIQLGEDRKARGMLRFGAHPDAAYIREDMLNGVRPHISVGYAVERLVLVEEDEALGNLYRAARWVPMEASSVAVPADISVGVGRGARDEPRSVPVIVPAEERAVSTNTDPTPAPQVAASPDDRLARLADLAASHGVEFKQFLQWKERGLSVEAAKDELLAAKRGQPIATPAGHVDLSPKEQKAYSLRSAILAHVNGTWSNGSLEREVSDTIEKRLGKSARGLFAPMNMEVRAGTAQQTSVAGDGGSMVQTTVGPFIDLLRNKMKVRELGAQVFTGLTDNLSMPRQITSSTFTWTGENPSAPAASKFTIDTVTLSPKTGIATLPLTRNLLTQSSIDAESIVRNDLAFVNALAVDLAALSGTGASNQPRGIAATPGITTMPGATSGAAPTWPALTAAEAAVAGANADINFATMAYLFTAQARGNLKNITRAGTFPVFCWADDNTVNGYPGHVSQQLRRTLTKGTGTNLHEAFFGDWSQLIIGEFGGALDIIVDPYSRKGEGLVELTSFLMVDVAVRYPAAFAWFNDLIIT